MKNVVIVDIDGTISRVGERLKYLKQEPKDWDSFYNDCFEDEPIPEMIKLLRHLYPKYNIIFCTGRRESCSSKTSRWMAIHTGCLFNCPILFRKNGDKRHDTEVKPELLEIAGFTPDNVAFILEDRTSMVKKWRELGFTCLQVAEGDF